jgi:hypothetical protein
MAKKVLVVLSDHGYWGEALIGPLEAKDSLTAGRKQVEVLENGIRRYGWQKLWL